MNTTFTVKKDELKVILEREFNAPRELVWKIMTDPEKIPQWWGPSMFKTKVDIMDFREGGQWRFINYDDKGQEWAFHGVYLKIDRPHTISDTFNFEGIPGDHELIEMAVLEETSDRKTKITSTSAYKNIEDLEDMLSSGMEGGAVETWERLAVLVEPR